jgi:hypothetical protein
MAWQAQVSAGFRSEGWGLNREMIGPGDDKGSGRLEISMSGNRCGGGVFLSYLSARADDANFQKTFWRSFAN